MTYDAVLAPGLDTASTTVEICFDTTCDTSRLATSRNPNVTGIRCEDVDGHTPSFPTECTFDDASRKLAFTTNTVYGGHAGSSTMTVTAVGANGTRTELLRGTVSFQDTSDETARAACTTAWQGSFHQG